MTVQEIIDRDLRLLIGDMQVQLVFARAQIVELQEQVLTLAAKIEELNGQLVEAMGHREQKPNGSKNKHPQEPPA